MLSIYDRRIVADYFEINSRKLNCSRMLLMNTFISPSRPFMTQVELIALYKYIRDNVDELYQSSHNRTESVIIQDLDLIWFPAEQFLFALTLLKQHKKFNYIVNFIQVEISFSY